MKTTDNIRELFVVVDKNDTVLSYKTRFDCHHDKNLIHRVTNIAIFNKKGEVLLQKRSMTKDLYPGMYTLSSSGHVSKGETYEEAARRETVEEIGIPDISLTFVAKQVVAAELETEMLALFRATYEGPYTFNKEEVEKLEYVDKKRMKEIESQLTPCAHVGLQILGWL